MGLRGKREAAALLGKQIGKAFALLAAGAALGTLLLALAYMLPVNAEKRDISYGIIEQEGWYPRTSIVSQGQYFQSYYPDVLDNFTDKIMLSTALDVSEGNPLARAMKSYSEFIGSYNHYWHGYVVVLRPLFLIFDFSEFRTLNGACQLLLVATLLVLIGREKGVPHALALLTSYILINPRTTALGLQYTWVFYVAYGGTAALLFGRRYFGQKDRYLYFFIALGMLTCYLDMLTFPLLTWGLPLVWWIVTETGEKKPHEWLRDVVISGFAWIFGYAGIWVAKWGIASLVLGENAFEAALTEIFYCSGTGAQRMDDLVSRWQAIYINWRHYAYKPYAVMLALWLVMWLARSLNRKWQRSGKACALFLVGISGPVWYVALSNHTIIHHFFTHRIYGVSIAAFLAIALESVGDYGESGKLTARERMGKLALLGASALLGCLCILPAKEETQVANGTGTFRQVQMERGLETEFTPAISTVESVHLGLECKSAQGSYEIKLWEGERLKYRTLFQLKDSRGGNYQEVITWWALKRGFLYRMTVEAVGVDEPVNVWLTEPGDLILSELGTVSVDGAQTGGQMLMGLRYLDRRYVPLERKIFLAVTWTGIFMAAGYVVGGALASHVQIPPQRDQI